MAKNALSKMTWGDLLPDRKVAGGEGVLYVDKALVAGATETEGYVALSLNERTIDQDVELLHHLKQFGVSFDFLPCEARIAPDVVAQFLLDAVNEGAGTFELQQGITARKGDRRLVVGDDLHQLVESALFPTLEIP